MLQNVGEIRKIRQKRSQIKLSLLETHGKSCSVQSYQDGRDKAQISPPTGRPGGQIVTKVSHRELSVSVWV